MEGTRKNSIPASAVPPMARSGIAAAAVAVAAVELTVIVAVAAVAPLIVAELGDTAQVIGSLAAAGVDVTAQEKLTAPVNPS